jgi:glycerophosphoryl diester phosphodiesterase
MAAGYPENTLAAFRHSVALGFPVIEVDLRATADGHIVIMHDETVDRTTSGTGEVGQMTLAEVRSLDAGSHAGPRFAGEPVPTYPETLEALRGSGATLVLDIKQGATLDNERVVRLTEQHGAAPDVIVGARGITDLLDFKRLNPSLRSLGLVPGPESGRPTPPRSRSSPPRRRRHHPPMAPVDPRQPRPGRPAGTVTTGETAP